MATAGCSSDSSTISVETASRISVVVQSRRHRERTSIHEATLREQGTDPFERVDEVDDFQRVGLGDGEDAGVSSSVSGREVVEVGTGVRRVGKAVKVDFLLQELDVESEGTLKRLRKVL